jgi:hypothetical protein
MGPSVQTCRLSCLMGPSVQTCRLSCLMGSSNIGMELNVFRTSSCF